MNTLDDAANAELVDELYDLARDIEKIQDKTDAIYKKYHRHDSPFPDLKEMVTKVVVEHGQKQLVAIAALLKTNKKRPKRKLTKDEAELGKMSRTLLDWAGGNDGE